MKAFNKKKKHIKKCSQCSYFGMACFFQQEEKNKKACNGFEVSRRKRKLQRSLWNNSKQQQKLK